QKLSPSATSFLLIGVKRNEAKKNALCPRQIRAVVVAGIFREGILPSSKNAAHPCAAPYGSANIRSALGSLEAENQTQQKLRQQLVLACECNRRHPGDEASAGAAVSVDAGGSAGVAGSAGSGDPAGFLSSASAAAIGASPSSTSPALLPAISSSPRRWPGSRASA